MNWKVSEEKIVVSDRVVGYIRLSSHKDQMNWCVVDRRGANIIMLNGKWLNGFVPGQSESSREQARKECEEALRALGDKK